MRLAAVVTGLTPLAAMADSGDIAFMETRCLAPLVQQEPFAIGDLRAVSSDVFDADPEPMLGQLPLYYIDDDTGHGLGVLEVEGLRACSVFAKDRDLDVAADAVFAMGERFDMGMPGDCAADTDEIELVFLMARAPREDAVQVRAAYFNAPDEQPEMLAFDYPGSNFSYSCEATQ